MPKGFKGFLLLLAAPLAASCANGPTYADIEPALEEPAPGQGRVFFFRPSAMGFAITPDLKLNDEIVGESVAGGFLWVDRPPGEYRASASTEMERSASFTLGSGQTRYVECTMTLGLFVGHLKLTPVDEESALARMRGLKYSGDPALLPEEPGAP